MNLKRIRTGALLLLAAVGASILMGSCARQTTEPVDRKVMIIGIDGLEWDIMGPMIDQGRLPTFARIMSEGAWGEVKSLDILESPVIWTSIATGKVPEKHGVMGFAKKMQPGAEPTPVTSNVRRVEAIWDILGDRGKSVGIVSWLATWPATQVNGYLVTDYFNYGWDETQSVGTEGLTFPPSLALDLRSLRTQGSNLPDDSVARLIRGAIPKSGDLRQRYELLKRTIASDLTTEAVAHRLWERMPVDFYAVYLKGIDGLCHMYWTDMFPGSGPPATDDDIQMFGEVIPRYYEDMDRTLARFLAMADENTTVIVTSDHGHSGPKLVNGVYKMGIAMHDPSGVVILWGKDVAQGVELSVPSVLDITPTILAMCGMPVARDMDGRVLTEGIDQSFLNGHPVSWIDTYEPEGGSREAASEEPIESPLDDQVREQLRALGYID
jgi:predicted AlkP superfamily phosphohydrolase/phosphomutase